MLDWRDITVPPGTPIIEALRILDGLGTQTLIVVDAQDRLIGTVSDGDFRRAVLRSVAMDAGVETIANTEPKTLPVDASMDSIRDAMAGLGVRYLPLVDPAGRVAGVAGLDAPAVAAPENPHWTVLMAGGKGARLRPLTEDRPKPLLEVGGKPILELMIESLARQGFRRFYVSVNYKAQMVKDHFGDGGGLDVEIRYLEEDRPLGTAGALGLVQDRHQEPLFVMNGDLLTKVNFASVLDFHRHQDVDATMCVREFRMEVPFGVVEVDNDRIADIVEKPVEQYLINAGIYLFEPRFLDLVEAGEALDIPDLLRRGKDAGLQITGFPIREFWLDIGRHEDYRRANESAADIIG